MPTSADLFLDRKQFGLWQFHAFWSSFCGLEGLTREFWAKNEKSDGRSKTIGCLLGCCGFGFCRLSDDVGA
jgi:hypothetical protein